MQQPLNDATNTPTSIPVVTPTAKVGEDALARLDELSSQLFDDELNDEQVRELNGLLTDNPEARSRYVESSLLHADLMEYFRDQKSDA